MNKSKRTTYDFDVVIPNNNEKVFIDTAIALGYHKIVFLTDNSNYVMPKDDRIKIMTAYLLKDPSDIQRAKKVFDYVFARAERKFFESTPDFIIGAEFSERKDSFHYKSTSLNQVHAKLAKKNSIIIVFGFNSVLSSKLTVGKMKQNMHVSKKYSLNSACFTLASTPMLMRSRHILDAFENSLSVNKP